MIRRYALVAFVFLLTSALPAQDVQAGFDESMRTWTLSSNVLSAQYFLDDDGRFLLKTLARPSGKNWANKGGLTGGPFQFAVDDQIIDDSIHWRLVDTHSESVAKGVRQVIRLSNEDLKAEVIVRLEVYPNQPFLHVQYGYHNVDADPHFVTDALYFQAHLNPEHSGVRAFSVNQVRQGTALMFGTSERRIEDQPERRITVQGGAYADSCTWLALRDDADNGLVFGWEFDGRGELNAYLSDTLDDLAVWGGPLSLHAPVAPDAEFNLPGAFVGLYEGDWDEAAYRTHRYVEAVLASPLPDEQFPYFAFDTWAYDQYIDEATMRQAALLASQIGVELFIVDLGWARQIGDWQEDLEKFPNGLRAFGDYVHSLGMKFGLHFVPAQANYWSPALLANPDWFSSEDENYFWADSICLSNQPTQDWIRQSARNLVTLYGADWITQDGENMVKNCSKTTHTHDPLNSNWSNSVEGIDALVRSMRAEFPKVQWENNEDGGTMSTFEAVKNYATFGSCDGCNHPDRRLAVWGMSYVFPPRFIDRYMQDEVTKFTTRSSMFGGPWILTKRITQMPAADLALMQQEAILYKQLRALIREGKVFHLLSPTWYTNEAIESFHPDQNRGVIFVYRPDTPYASETIYPRGLQPNQQYLVTFQESHETIVSSGAALMSKGIAVKLPTKDFAEIVYINAH